MIEYSKDKHSLSCPISPTGDFIIPPNRVLAKSRYQHVLNHLQLLKKTKQRNNAKRKRGRVLGKKKGKCKTMGTVETIGKAHQREPVMGTIKMVIVEILFDQISHQHLV